MINNNLQIGGGVKVRLLLKIYSENFTGMAHL